MAYLGYSATYNMDSGHVQLSDMSVNNPLVTPIHNWAICVNLVIFFAEWMHVCFEEYC